MGEFYIPHQAPIRFAQSVITSSEKECLVNVSFETIPTLGMLLESAAQSSLAILDSDTNMEIGFLISLKNVKLLNPPKEKNLTARVELLSSIGRFKNKKFEIIENQNLIATGKFSVAIQ